MSNIKSADPMSDATIEPKQPGAERTTDKLWRLCGRVLDLFTETECRNYLRHCGYR